MAIYIVKTTPPGQEEICVQVHTVNIKESEAREMFKQYLSENHPNLDQSNLEFHCKLA